MVVGQADALFRHKKSGEYVLVASSAWTRTYSGGLAYGRVGVGVMAGVDATDFKYSIQAWIYAVCIERSTDIKIADCLLLQLHRRCRRTSASAASFARTRKWCWTRKRERRATGEGSHVSGNVLTLRKFYERSESFLRSLFHPSWAPSQPTLSDPFGPSSFAPFVRRARHRDMLVQAARRSQLRTRRLSSSALANLCVHLRLRKAGAANRRPGRGVEGRVDATQRPQNPGDPHEQQDARRPGLQSCT